MSQHWLELSILKLDKDSQQTDIQTQRQKKNCQLVTEQTLAGPFKINGCPLRRVNQRFVVATSTSIDLSGAKLPEKIDDAYFRRARKEKKGAAKKEGDIFEAKKESYKVS